MIGYTRVYTYCRKDEIEKIENYDLAKNDPDEVWVIHHRMELTLNGEFAHTQDELKRLGMFYHRPYYELIFLRRSDHQRLHNSALSNSTLNKRSKSAMGHTLSSKSREKIRLARLGKEPWNKGKKLNYSTSHPHTDITKQKISKLMKGRNKGKPLSDTNRLNIAKAYAEISDKYRTYKSNGGTMSYNEFRASIKKSR